MLNSYQTSGTSPTKRKLKVVMINAEFPELQGGSVRQTGKGQGSSLRVAFSAAGRDLFSQPKLKRKRFTSFKATFSVNTEAA
jgi:hypothetical protein